MARITIALLLLAGVLLAAAFSPTCPQEDARCKEENVCSSCHPSCKFCQKLSEFAQPQECSPQDCITCSEGLTHLPFFDDDTGACVYPTADVLQSLPPGHRGKIFIINLKRRPDRLALIEEELHRVNAWPTSNTSHLWQDVEVMEAVDGTEDNRVRKLMADRGYALYGGLTAWDQVSGRTFTAGEIGCALSHVAAWEEILRQNLTFGVVIEDDAHFRLDMVPRVTASVGKYLLTGKYDFLYMGRSIKDQSTPEAVVDALLSLREPSFSWWTIAYVITAEGVHKVLKDNRFVENLLVIDEFLPAIINSTNYSDIHGTRAATKVNFADLEPLRALAFAAGSELVDAQWDYTAKGTEEYNSDVTVAEPFLRMEDIETGIFQTAADDVDDTGKLLPVDEAVKIAHETDTPHYRLVIVTVATEATPGYQRFIKTCIRFGIPVRTYGLGVAWEGGDMLGPGGGQKINLLRDGLNSLTAELLGVTEERPEGMCGAGVDSCGEEQARILRNTVVLFTDSYDAIITGPPADILRRYLHFESNIVFSAELFCWPYSDYASRYATASSPDPYKYLNSGGFVGTLSALHRMFSIGGPVQNRDDDQGYYTDFFLHAHANEVGVSVTLDTQAYLFQTLHGMERDEYDMNRFSSLFHNRLTNTYPLIIHGNGPWYVKTHLNWISNYLAWLYLHTLGDHPGRSLAPKVLTKPNKPVLDAESTHCPTLLVSVVIETAFDASHWQRFVAGIAAQDYPRRCTLIRLTPLVEDDSFIYDLVVPRLRGSSIQDPFAGIDVVYSDGPVAMAYVRALTAAAHSGADAFLSLDPAALLMHPTAFRTLVYDNAPGLTTLSLVDTDGESTFYMDVTPRNEPIVTADYDAVLRRLMGTGHDFSGASAYPHKSLLNVACARYVHSIPKDLFAVTRQVYNAIGALDGAALREAVCVGMRHKAIFILLDWGFWLGALASFFTWCIRA